LVNVTSGTDGDCDEDETVACEGRVGEKRPRGGPHAKELVDRMGTDKDVAVAREGRVGKKRQRGKLLAEASVDCMSGTQADIVEDGRAKFTLRSEAVAEVVRNRVSIAAAEHSSWCQEALACHSWTGHVICCGVAI